MCETHQVSRNTSTDFPRYNFIMMRVGKGHIRGPVDELTEHLHTSPGAASAELSRAMK